MADERRRFHLMSGDHPGYFMCGLGPYTGDRPAPDGMPNDVAWIDFDKFIMCVSGSCGLDGHIREAGERYMYCFTCIPGKGWSETARWRADQFIRIMGERISAMKSRSSGAGPT